MSSRMRRERDSIGAVDVPRGALYGIHTQRAVENMSFSARTLGTMPAYVRALAEVKKAAALANREARLLDARRVRAIARACDALIPGAYQVHFPVDLLSGGGSIAINMNINEVIANLANQSLGGRPGKYDPVDPKAHVNKSQSTADVCHTAARIAILELWPTFRETLKRCATAMRVKEHEFSRVFTIARTCLRDASPVALGTLFGGYLAAIERRTDELNRAMTALHRINLGGTVIGAHDGAPMAYRDVILKHLFLVTRIPLQWREDLYDAAQNSDDLGAIAAAMGLLAEVLLKVAEDLRLLSSGPDSGFGEIKLPEVQEGSSYFAGKMNPVIAETMMQCCFQVLACERAARLALERAELNLNVFEGAAIANIVDALAMLNRAVSSFTEKCVSGIVVVEERCLALAARSRLKAS